MTLEDALTAAFLGKRIYRDGWREQIFWTRGSTWYEYDAGPDRRYIPTPDDMEATDWKVATTTAKAGERNGG